MVPPTGNRLRRSVLAGAAKDHKSCPVVTSSRGGGLAGRRRVPAPSPVWAGAVGEEAGTGDRGYVVLARARTISRQKAGRSSGFREVIRLPSTTTSLSDH